MVAALSDEIQHHPTPSSAGEEQAVAVVLPVDSFHPSPMRSIFLSTLVPSSLSISQRFVAGDCRKLLALAIPVQT